MKNKDLIRAVSEAVGEDKAIKAIGVELLDTDLDDVAGGAVAPSCTGMKCGTYSGPSGN